MSRFSPIFIVYSAPQFSFSLLSILKTPQEKATPIEIKDLMNIVSLEVDLKKSLNLVSTSRIYVKEERDRKIKELEKKLKKMENSQERSNLL